MKSLLQPDFPQWLRLLSPMGQRSVRARFTTLQAATLAQIESRLGRFLPGCLFHQRTHGNYSRERIFTLHRTYWCFLWQMLQANTTLREVVRQVQALFKLRRGRSVDEDTGGYAQARSKLPLSLLEQTLTASARAAVRLAPKLTLLGGRPLKVIDGSTCRLADTPANQRVFPQQTNQPPGCGFPILRLVVLFCAQSGAIIARRVGSLHRTELKLFYELLDHIRPQDILIGDRHFGNFTIVALLLSRLIDFIGRVPAASRRVDFRKGQRLGKDDAVFVWRKAPAIGRWLPAKIRQTLPGEIRVRIVRLRVRQKGFRPRSLTLVTTLLDPRRFPAQEIARAYLRRWRLEMCLDDLKITLHLRHLKCLSPRMANKELLAGLVAHNLVRCLMAQSARDYDLPLDRISFKGSLDGWRQFSHALAQCWSGAKRKQLWDLLLQTLAADLVLERPGRLEPRAIKSISKYPKLTRHRSLQHDRPSRNVRKSIARRGRVI
jgi:DDE family transposase